MNDNTSRIFTFVLAILALVGIVLGIAALGSSASTRNSISEMQSKIENEISVASQLTMDVSSLTGKAQNSFNALVREVRSIKMELTNMVVKVEAPAPKQVKASEGGSSAADAKGGTSHTIGAGDTLGRLAKQYGTSVEAIEKLNPGVDSRRLKLNQKIRVK